VREAHDRWGDAFIVEYATGDCTDTRRVDVEVIETR